MELRNILKSFFPSILLSSSFGGLKKKNGALNIASCSKAKALHLTFFHNTYQEGQCYTLTGSSVAEIVVFLDFACHPHQQKEIKMHVHVCVTKTVFNSSLNVLTVNPDFLLLMIVELSPIDGCMDNCVVKVDCKSFLFLIISFFLLQVTNHY